MKTKRKEENDRDRGKSLERKTVARNREKQSKRETDRQTTQMETEGLL
jgi:hypothetical protein